MHTTIIDRMHRPLIAAAIGALAATALGACMDDADPTTCVVDGVEHAPGDTFPADDGCNTCTCGDDGEVSCTLIGCVETCTYQGTVHEVGTTFPAGDGCNTCSCGEGGLVACTGLACPPPVTCTHEGETYEPGESFPAGDGCNTCSCTEDGQVACTLMPCIVGCEHEGQTYELGETFPAGDDCNTCTCEEGGQVSCTKIACIDTCEYGGATYAEGDSFPADDGCNTCTCMEGGEVACTEIACPETCTYDRQTWQVGDTFPAIDGCNTCTCMAGGQIACTAMACICDPESEWWRQYYGLSPEECAAINYRCVEWTSSFENECGCGCEQSAECEREIECYYPECDARSVAVECPYSTIDTSRDCSAEQQCPQGTGFCTRPDQDLGCGICMNPPEEEVCQGDGDCAAGSICEPLRCACMGQHVCVPGCTSDAECGEGEACGDDGRCAAARCQSQDECPVNFRCDSGGCLRRACTTSESCEGYCVGGSCYAEPGSCNFPPP